jgi:serine phosphatase RsbU (regulator of sigma subunit)
MPLRIDIAIAKTNKYASRESGDTVEIVERPGGGMSVILADGQGSGRAAKSLSMLVTAKVSSLIKEGVRDGACARAANDFLHAMRHGQVSATLDILSVDLKTSTVVISRNGDSSYFIQTDDRIEVNRGTERALGLHSRTRPWAAEFPITSCQRVVLISDGIANSGMKSGLATFDLARASLEFEPDVPAQTIADSILAEAIARDKDKPGDDMSVVALALNHHQDQIVIRRMNAEVPLP